MSRRRRSPAGDRTETTGGGRKHAAGTSFLETYNDEKHQVVHNAAASAFSAAGGSRANFAVERRFRCSSFGFSGSWRSTLAEIFLPKGFPSSVTPDYVEYQTWDTVQAFASSLSGTFATAAVLKGAGVGDETATVLAASLSWVLKDGVGMIGRILFAWIFGTALDADSKRWRLIADILNDLAFCIDLTCSHTERHFFMATVCCSSLMRAIVGVAGGGTRMAVVRHQARRENLADVAAKDGSQETLVGIVSLLTSLVLLPLFDSNPMGVWAMFAALTAVHLGANYAAVCSLQFDIFNESRLRIVARELIETGRLLDVREANRREPLIPGGRCTRRFGCSLLALNECTKRGFFCDADGRIRAQLGWRLEADGRDFGVLIRRRGATAEDVLLAAFQLEFLILHSKFPNAHEPPDTSELDAKLAAAGWNTSAHLLPLDEFAYEENS
ncbi:hypothetical protein M3Y99_00266100 [Aphelenchoides fujianensis]|nr:hypothetical protein M3Y99_00266100 [Aphelenchoides fujianensis]